MDIRHMKKRRRRSNAAFRPGYSRADVEVRQQLDIHLDLVVAILGTGVPGKPVRRLAKESSESGHREHPRLRYRQTDGDRRDGGGKELRGGRRHRAGETHILDAGNAHRDAQRRIPPLIHFADMRQETLHRDLAQWGA